MTLLVDGQIFQTEARDRGMGRYSVCLIQAIVKQAHYSEVEIILSKNMQNQESLLDDLATLFPNTKFITLNLLTTEGTSIEKASSHNKRILNDYIISKHNRDNTEYLIPSLFQEPLVSVYPDNVVKTMIFYDLIPYLYHERYSLVMKYNNYLKRFKYIFEADYLFTISKSVMDDLHVFLGVPHEKMVCIDGAPIRLDHKATKPDFSVPKNFILMPTSDDARKNNLRAVLAFEEYVKQSKTDTTLIITSKIHKTEREKLMTFSSNLLFTGNLADDTLNWLYQNCEAVLFVPESEGLGLPILEAVEAHKPVVCSSLPVFKEISEAAFWYCDHENPTSIARALASALDKRRRLMPAEYTRILKHYSWHETARRFIHDRQENTETNRSTNKPKIAVFAPTPDGVSAVGKVVAELHPVLTKYFDVDYFIEPGLYHSRLRPNYLQYVANCLPAHVFSTQSYRSYDAVFYHVGNGDYHLESIKNALHLPGYVIIHDTNIQEAYRVLHEEGMIHTNRLKIEEQISTHDLTRKTSHLTTLLNHQLGVITHSDYASEAIRGIVPEASVQKLNLASATSELPNYRSGDVPVIGMAGIIAGVKGVGIIEGLSQRPDLKECEFRVFGISHETQDVLNRLNSYDNMRAITNLTDYEFNKQLGKLNIFVNYRLAYNGETSLSTIEAMRQGVVVVVRNIGWYSELPDDSVVKVNSEKEIEGVLKELINKPDKLLSIGQSAKRYVEEHCSHEQYAEGWLGMLQSNSPERVVALRKNILAMNPKTPQQFLKIAKQVLK